MSTRRPAEILADRLLSALLDDAQAAPNLRAWAARFAVYTSTRLQTFAGEYGLPFYELSGDSAPPVPGTFSNVFDCTACEGHVGAGKTCHRCGRKGPLGQGLALLQLQLTTCECQSSGSIHSNFRGDCALSSRGNLCTCACHPGNR